MSFARENETKEVSFSLFFMLCLRAVGKVLLLFKRFVFFFLCSALLLLSLCSVLF